MRTPGMSFIDCSPTLTTFGGVTPPAIWPCGQTTRPCSMPGTRTCCMYSYLPLTLSAMSIRGTRVPEIDVARENRGGVVGVDRDVRIDRGRIRRARFHPTFPGRRAGILGLGARSPGDADSDDDGPGGFQELAARQHRADPAGVALAG